MNRETDAQTIELEHRIADLRERLPRHSVPAAMLIELEELEETLFRLQSQDAAVKSPARSDQ